MKNKKHLYVLYSTQSIQGETNYQILDFLTPFNFVSTESLAELESVNPKGSRFEFRSLEELGSFCLELCKKEYLQECYLLSITEFNKALVSNIEEKEDFETCFEDFGTKIELSKEERSLGFLGRIFN